MDCVLGVVVICLLPVAVSANEDATYQRQLAERRGEYVNWIGDTFGQLEPTMDPLDGRRWALNHARLVLNRELDEANRFFESFGPLTRDSDIYFIRFLRTLLDFRDSPRLSDKSEAHIVGMLKGWPQNELSSLAHWPPRHTENHDLMHLTIGMCRPRVPRVATSRTTSARSGSLSRGGWNGDSSSGTRSATSTTSPIR